MNILKLIKKKRQEALESRLKKKEAEMQEDMQEDEELKEYNERKAKVDEYYNKRKGDNPLKKLGEIIKKEIVETGKNPPTMFGNENPLLNNNDTHDKDAKKKLPPMFRGEW